MLKELTIALSAGAISAGIVIYYFNNKNSNEKEWFKHLFDKQYRLIEKFYNSKKKTESPNNNDLENQNNSSNTIDVEDQLNHALNNSTTLPSPPPEQLNENFTKVEHSDAIEQPKRSTSMASFFDSIKLSQLRK